MYAIVLCLLSVISPSWSLGGGALPSNAVAGSTGSLLVERVREGDGTLYCCDVGNTHGTASSCKVIKILSKPVQCVMWLYMYTLVVYC